MDDTTVLERINQLAAEEEELYERAGAGGGLSTDDSDRLREIEVALDQAYDLLRQRQARRAAGLDPDEAEVRPENVVEGYLQ